MNNKTIGNLREVLSIIQKNSNVSFKDQNLLSISDSEIITPIGDMIPLLHDKRSTLEDQFVDLELLKKLISKLSANNSITGLDHIGFCYKVNSLEIEKERVTQLVKSSSYKLYQEPSNDDALWLFMGNLENWQNPVIELVPIEKTNDKWVDYWLPHIQIDIDTNLNGKEIEDLVKTICGNAIYPFSIVIGKRVCIVRNRLGTIDGVNITIDLATTARDVKALRQKVWKMVE